jgi:CRP-like cAMP-binding protein
MHPLRKHIEKTVALTDDEFEKIISKFKNIKVRKHHFVLQEGNICNFDSFVINGSLRQYQVDKQGKVHVVEFAFRNNWITGCNAIIAEKPSIYNIDALEHSEIIQIEKSNLENLFIEIPKLNKYFRKIFQSGFAVQQRRILFFQKTAEERYLNFIETYQHFEQKVSQVQIASYLGITRESLSRIKTQMIKKE